MIRFASHSPPGLVLALLLLLLGADGASGAIPGPPLDAGPAFGAYCLPRGDDALGGAGFAGAVAAVAWIARRRRRAD